MKKVLSTVLILTIISSLFLFGCSSDSSQEDKLKVAMLLSGPISDQGWNATAYSGLKMIEEKLGAEVAYAENISQSDFEEFFRSFAEQDYDIVFGHGFQFGDAAMKVAKNYPDTKFIITSTDVYQAPNVASLKNNNKEQGFLAGALSAMITKTNTIAAIGGMEIPSITAYMDGFNEGAKYINPNINILATYTGDFKDAAKSKELAYAMINKGADVLNHDADAAGLGVIEAGKEKGIMTLGAISDQYELAPEVIVSSSLSDLSKAIYKMTETITKENNFEAKEYILGIKEETVGLAPYHDFEDKVPQEVKDKMNQIMKDISSGKIEIKW